MKRKRYAPTHWARTQNAEKALKDYLTSHHSPYNRIKELFFDRLLGNDLTGATVLDYGGGAGLMSIICARKGATVCLIEAEEAALEAARLHAEVACISHRIEFIRAESIPPEITSRKFDIILAKDIIEHIPDDRKFLLSLSRCQDEGGMLILSTQNRHSLNFFLQGTYNRCWHKNKDWYGWDSTHLRFYTPQSLQRLLSTSHYLPMLWRSVYLVPYDILSWFFLLRKRIVLEKFNKLDLYLGDIPIINKCGWNVIVMARRVLADE
ncbi:MAG: hypothetical protein CVU57_12895 [Deltaproteobacteria bacterium HGW-Deltaproteobacteria-15]|jgi:2-polyprenyl-6-hydroxyphenyl methylase/3-demethylubiquinone-9 3-methyltransferase|nr:MAG: hypothetical protein CVU57_12895 [Deltaproteobacteria bacterium HGW-Deltaproteobacteria-15]